jgi:hypothetical protein
MVRILILIILVWALYQIVKRILASASSNTDANPEQKPEQKIVQCAYCGCHVPENESQIKNNKIVCNNPECQTQKNQEDQHGD